MDASAPREACRAAGEARCEAHEDEDWPETRPEFTIVDWREISGGGGGSLQNEARQIEQRKPEPAEQVGRPIKPVTTEEALNN